ncbi:fungal-specific transcription factor domain-containing protein [Mycena latifolia]|nr:fungal-specific transcription factor domain-containing protein [Mycena latifolia]
MSSDEETPSPPSGSNLSLKQRRLHRSCDICRQRKIRCDGSKMPNSQCSNCLAFGSSCTYERPAKKRGPKNQLVEELRQKNAVLEAKLRSLSICSLCAQPLKSQEDENGISSPSVFNTTNSDSAIEAEPLPEEDPLNVELVDRFRTLCIHQHVTEDKFFGSSSSFVLVSNALAVKEEYLGRPAAIRSRTALYWELLPWEKDEYDQRPRYVYPPGDLIASLLDLYFANVHPFLPVLHRPSFERSVVEGLYLKDPQFGAAFLAVLGVASRYSNDSRVFVEADTSLSAGWKFVKQVQVVRKLFEPSLYDVQFHALMTLFHLGSSAPQNSWLHLGIGIRSLQQRGEHRRKRLDRKRDALDEMWRRAFWSILSLDRLLCFFLGRPAGIHTEDYDVDLPLEMDDEYWGQEFAQPPEKPSLLSYFVYHIQLCEILGDALRRLYASHKSRMRMGWDSIEWEQRAVAELDSALHVWLDSVPTHLRWDPDKTSDIFFQQSAVLFTTYHAVQIAIHRPYIHRPTVLASPSLSICTSAARSALNIADVWLKKVKQPPSLPYMMNPVFVSGVILMLNIFGTKRNGPIEKNNKDLVQVETALRFHKAAQSRWQPAGRVAELLQELMSLDGPLPLKRPPKNNPASADNNTSKVEAVLVLPVPSVPVQPAGMSQPEYYLNHETEPVPNHLWNNIHSDPSLASGNDPQSGIDIQQLLADTAQFDTINLSPNSATTSSGPILDDELMSLWMAAPTNFANIDQWDAYIGTGMMNVEWPGLDVQYQ